MTPDFVSQYLIANSGTEVPKRYTRWAAIALLSATIGRRAYVNHGHFKIFPWMYYCFVGVSGSGKTTAKDQAKNMFLTCFPDFPLGGNIASREDLVRSMASDSCAQFYKDESGETVEWRPYACFVNELSNFVSFAPGAMVEFLTDIFDSEVFTSRTIKRGNETVPKPYLFLLSCTTPDYIIHTFKASILSGGFSRRILFIYDLKEVEQIITHPEKTPEAYAAEQWCIAHLKSVAEKQTVAFTWTPEAKEFLHKWNVERVRPRDSVLAGYYKSKDLIVQKIAMCLAYAIPGHQPVLTVPLLETAIAYIESNEDNLPRLTVAAGGNKLAVPASKLLVYLEQNNGVMPEKMWHRLATADLQEMEYYNMKKSLRETDQIVEFPQDGKQMVAFKHIYEELKALEGAKQIT